MHGQQNVKIHHTFPMQADASGREVKRVGLRPFACWDCGFESLRSMDICLLWVLCVVRSRSLRRADHSFRGALPIVLCRCL